MVELHHLLDLVVVEQVVQHVLSVERMGERVAGEFAGGFLEIGQVGGDVGGGWVGSGVGRWGACGGVGRGGWVSRLAARSAHDKRARARPSGRLGRYGDHPWRVVDAPARASHRPWKEERISLPF